MRVVFTLLGERSSTDLRGMPYLIMLHYWLSWSSMFDQHM